MISVCILGSTGSIGKSVFKIIDYEKNIKIRLLSANKNFKLICYQIKKYKTKYFIINNYRIYWNVKKKIKKSGTKVLNNFDNIKFKELIFLYPLYLVLQVYHQQLSDKFVNKLLIAIKNYLWMGDYKKRCWEI